jgi:hypothetical protein
MKGIRCLKCGKKVVFLGKEKVKFDKSPVRTYGCLHDGFCIFLPTPKKGYFYWSEAEKGKLVGGLKKLSIEKLKGGDLKREILIALYAVNYEKFVNFMEKANELFNSEGRVRYYVMPTEEDMEQIRKLLDEKATWRATSLTPKEKIVWKKLEKILE